MKDDYRSYIRNFYSREKKVWKTRKKTKQNKTKSQACMAFEPLT